MLDEVALRDRGLLASAAARPQTTVFGEDAYPSFAEKAAALMHSLARNHPLVDGNKRLGWLACAVFLDVNGVDPTNASNDGVYELVMRVASQPIEVAELAALLQALVTEVG